MFDQNQVLTKMMAVTAMSQSLDIILRRDYLNESIWEKESVNILNCRKEPISLIPPYMIELSQVGTPNSISVLNLEKVLRASHSPGQYELIFLLKSNGVFCRLFLGIRKCGYDVNPVDTLTGLGHVLSASYPGTMFTPAININNKSILEKDLLFLSSITGIPSTLENQDRQRGNNINLVDMLIRGMHGKPFAYIVSSVPVETQLIDPMIFRCREMQGQAESLRNLTITNTDQESFAKSLQQTFGTSHSVSTSDSTSHKDVGIGLMLGALGFVAGSILFPPAMAIAPLAGMGLFSSFTPSTSLAISKMEGQSKQYGETFSHTEGISTAVTANYVNKHVEAMANILGSWVKRLQVGKTSGFWNTRTYVLTQSSNDLHLANLLIKSALEGERNDIEPIRTHNLDWCWNQVSSCLSNMLIPDITVSTPESHPLGELFCHLSTPMSTSELCSLINLPQRSAPGITVLEAVDETGQEAKPMTPLSIAIGKQIHAGSETQLVYPIEVDQLTRHTLVCGMTRKGKTNTCKHILKELIRIKGEKVPFLVIEPAKAEYVDWALEMNQRMPNSINIFMPGRHTRKGHKLKELHINPFDVVWTNHEEEPRVLEHIQRLSTIINASLPMQESLPVLMEEAIYACYEEVLPSNSPDPNAPMRQWLPSTRESKTPERGTPFPTFKTLAKWAPQVIQKKGYHTDAHKGLTAAMATRIESFMRGWKKECFFPNNTEIFNWDQLFNMLTVINLSALSSDDDKAFFMSVLFMFLYEYRQIQHDSESNDSELKHILLIEEAHRLLCNTHYHGAGSIDPRGKVAEMFSNMISEIGGYGQGIIIADQVPGRLSPDAIKNTNLKLVHRLVDFEDREMMSICLDLKPSHRRLLGALETGQAIVRGDTDKEPVWIKVTKAQ